MNDFETRVGAYGVAVWGDRVLLVHLAAPQEPRWTLPGGGLELGEDGPAAAVREIREETGYDAILGGLLGADSVQIPPAERLDGCTRHLHALRLIYRVQIVGGERRGEIGGTTDAARWFPLDEVPELDRVPLVDAGLRLWREGDLRRGRSNGRHAARPVHRELG